VLPFIGMSVGILVPVSYEFMCPRNIFEKAPDATLVCEIIMLQAATLVCLAFQKIKGPRFMVPVEWRRDPNTYNYYFKFATGERRSGLPARAAEQPEEAVECVICMNKIIWEVDGEGNVIDKDN
jgi:hypothetical protein